MTKSLITQARNLFDRYGECKKNLLKVCCLENAKIYRSNEFEMTYEFKDRSKIIFKQNKIIVKDN